MRNNFGGEYVITKKFRRIIKVTVLVIICGIITTLVYLFSREVNNINVVSEASEKASKEAQQNKNELRNVEYLTLDKDPNAEDALEVNNITDKLLKKEINYPVRNDGKKVVYLTFDDGPSTTNTPVVLDILNKYNIKATFFIIGREVDSSEGAKKVLRRIVKEGHAIGNHTYSHNYDYLFPNRVINANNFISDIEKTNETFRNVLGKDFSTRVIRFPGGYWSWEGRSAIRPAIDEKKYAIIGWNALDGDAEKQTPQNAEALVARAKQTINDLGPNADSIVFLMHDTYGKEESEKALPNIIEYFKEKGFEFKILK